MSPRDVLQTISLEISTDQALATMRKSDAGALAQLLVQRDDALWIQVDTALEKLLGDKHVATIARLWLVGQALQPLTAEQIGEQTDAIVTLSL